MVAAEVEPCCTARPLLLEWLNWRCCSACQPFMFEIPSLSLCSPLQIAALVNAATLDVPSPLSSRTSMPPAMLSSPTSNKPTGPAAPIAPAPGPAGAPTAPISFSQAVAGGAQANGRRRA